MLTISYSNFDHKQTHFNVPVINFLVEQEFDMKLCDNNGLTAIDYSTALFSFRARNIIELEKNF